MDYLQQSLQNRILALLIAAAVDLLIGDPHWLWHPVQGVGSLISFFEKILRRIFAVPPRQEEPGKTDRSGVKEEKEERVKNNADALFFTQEVCVEAPQTSAGSHRRNCLRDFASGVSAQERFDMSGRGEKAEKKDRKEEKAVLSASAERGFRIRERIAGLLMVILVLIVSTGLIFCLLLLCGRIHPCLRLVFEGVLCGRLLALRSLGEAGCSVRDPLLRGDIEGARRAVSMIVGRDTGRLNAEGIAKAAVETVAENTSDGVTAPLFYMILFGGLGGIFYKAVNTMDSMTGYKNARYRYFGTAAARLDDAMNFIPARLTALFMILACCLPGKETVSVRENVRETKAGGDGRTGSIENLSTNAETGFTSDEGGRMAVRIPDGAAAYRIWRRDRLKSPSPNSAQTESVCAGALHLRLLGDTWYFGEIHHKAEIGDGGRNVEAEDITRSVRLMNRTAILLFLSGILVLLLAEIQIISAISSLV